MVYFGRPYHEGLVGDIHHAERGVIELRLHAGQMMLEDGIVIGGKEILRPPPRPLALDYRIDGDVADPDLFHRLPHFWESVTGALRSFKRRADMQAVAVG